MNDYPVHFRLAGRLCVVVGGGSVGRRKVEGLLAAGAQVRLIEPGPLDGALAGRVEHRQRPYRNGDLEEGWLAFAATGDATVNRAVAAEARRRGIPVSLADAPDFSDFTLPACRRLEGITLSVATGGSSPALAALLADHLAGLTAPGWPQLLDLAAALRSWQLTHPEKAAYNQSILRQMIEAGIVGLLAEGHKAAVDRLLRQFCGPECNLDELRIQLSQGVS